MDSLYWVTFSLSFLCGALAVTLFHLYFRRRQDEKGEDVILRARKEANEIEEKAFLQAEKVRNDIEKREERINQTEERLFRKEEEIRTKEAVEKVELEVLQNKGKELSLAVESLKEKEKNFEKENALYLGVSKEELLLTMIQKVEREHEEDILSRLYKLGIEGEKRFEQVARDLLVNAVYRIGNTEVASFTSSQVEIDDPELKGKIIGKEGRNIKTFERATGVDLIIDESPHLIVISCFDPVRRAIAKNALEMLIKDGRIQPAKIEEYVEKAKRDIGLFMKKKGEEAIMECGLIGIPDALAPLVGRLYFRTSYGQNVLNHSIEMAHIAGLLATELGVDAYTARAGALLHDIGKAVDHEIKGTHVEIGRKILSRYGVDERIIKAMQSHHEEYPYETVESIIVQVADAISGGRPGARRDTVDRYIERLSDLEAIAMAFSGIEKVYALQAGREIRIFVSPTLVSDLEARTLARDIAKKVEEELRFPGEIKITVIRESYAIDFAR